MEQSVTFTVKVGEEKKIISVGEKVFLSKRTIRMLPYRLFKKHYFIARMKKKKYKPAFIVTASFSPSKEFEQATLKPFNF